MIQRSKNLVLLSKIGLTAKGLVYLALGALVFMAAFEILGTTNKEATKEGVYKHIWDLPAGAILLSLVGIGLLCYSIWRAVSSYVSLKQKEWTKGLRYLASAIIYLLATYSVAQLLMQKNKSGGDQHQYWATKILQESYGQVLLGLAAVVLAAIGIYQAWYGLSEKYKKHVNENISLPYAGLLLRSGKIGYVARSAVWLIFSFLLGKAAINSDGKEAGDTNKAFGLIEGSSYGSILLGSLGLGLICYGIFCMLRAMYQKQ